MCSYSPAFDAWYLLFAPRVRTREERCPYYKKDTRFTAKGVAFPREQQVPVETDVRDQQRPSILEYFRQLAKRVDVVEPDGPQCEDAYGICMHAVLLACTWRDFKFRAPDGPNLRFAVDVLFRMAFSSLAVFNDARYRLPVARESVRKSINLAEETFSRIACAAMQRLPINFDGLAAVRGASSIFSYDKELHMFSTSGLYAEFGDVAVVDVLVEYKTDAERPHAVENRVKMDIVSALEHRARIGLAQRPVHAFAVSSEAARYYVGIRQDSRTRIDKFALRCPLETFGDWLDLYAAFVNIRMEICAEVSPSIDGAAVVQRLGLLRRVEPISDSDETLNAGDKRERQDDALDDDRGSKKPRVTRTDIISPIPTVPNARPDIQAIQARAEEEMLSGTRAEEVKRDDVLGHDDGADDERAT